MVEQPKLQEPQKPAEAAKPKDAAPKAAAKPAPAGNPLTAEAGNGPSQYGLGVGDGGGNVVGGGGGGGGSRFGFYAGLIQSQVQTALRQDDATRAARYRIVAKLWLSTAGQVTRAELVSSTGDRTVDAAIARVLSSLAIGQGPPQDMPQPVNIRITAQG
jgi:outer membrane biosynthesis protein TonB